MDDIGQYGRFVRCSQCGYEWVATVEEAFTLSDLVSRKSHQEDQGDTKSIVYTNKECSNNTRHFIRAILLASTIFFVGTVLFFYRYETAVLFPSINKLGDAMGHQINHTLLLEKQNSQVTIKNLGNNIEFHTTITILKKDRLQTMLSGFDVVAFDNNGDVLADMFVNQQTVLTGHNIVKLKVPDIPSNTSSLSITAVMNTATGINFIDRRPITISKLIKLYQISD